MNTVFRPIKTASICFLALLLLVAFLSDSVAQRRGGWGGSYYRSTPTYRPAPPRPMTPRYIQPSAPRMASMPRSPGGGPMTVRTMPRSITPTATVAKMPSYTGRVTFKGAPIIVSRTGKPFSIPQKGIFSTRVVSTFQYIRTTFTRYFVGGRVAVLQTRIAKYAKETKLITTAKFPKGMLGSTAISSGTIDVLPKDQSSRQVAARLEAEKQSIGAARNPIEIAKSASPVWKSLKNYRNDIKTNGLTGKDKRYYQWDHTHGDIEIYNNQGKHLGSLDPESGTLYKPPVAGRLIKL